MDRYLLDIERLKKLAPIMKELGVQANRWWIEPNFSHPDNASKTFLADNISIVMEYKKDGSGFITAAYDYASFESVLPDWWSGLTTYIKSPTSYLKDFLRGLVPESLMSDVYNLMYQITMERGQKKLECMADTIILLHENNLLKKQKEKNSNGK